MPEYFFGFPCVCVCVCVSACVTSGSLDYYIHTSVTCCAVLVVDDAFVFCLAGGTWARARFQYKMATRCVSFLFLFRLLFCLFEMDEVRLCSVSHLSKIYLIFHFFDLAPFCFQLLFSFVSLTYLEIRFISLVSFGLIWSSVSASRRVKTSPPPLFSLSFSFSRFVKSYFWYETVNAIWRRRMMMTCTTKRPGQLWGTSPLPFVCSLQIFLHLSLVWICFRMKTFQSDPHPFGPHTSALPRKQKKQKSNGHLIGKFYKIVRIASDDIRIQTCFSFVDKPANFVLLICVSYEILVADFTALGLLAPLSPLLWKLNFPARLSDILCVILAHFFAYCRQHIYIPFISSYLYILQPASCRAGKLFGSPRAPIRLPKTLWNLATGAVHKK